MPKLIYDTVAGELQRFLEGDISLWQGLFRELWSFGSSRKCREGKRRINSIRFKLYSINRYSWLACGVCPVCSYREEGAAERTKNSRTPAEERNAGGMLMSSVKSTWSCIRHWNVAH